MSVEAGYPLRARGEGGITNVTVFSDRLSAEYLEHHGVLPLLMEGEALRVATWRPEVDGQVLDDLGLIFGCSVRLVQGEEAEIRDTIHRVYRGEETARDMIADLASTASESEQREVALDDLVNQANEAVVVKLVNLLLLEALDARASDVHLETYPDVLRVRYRIDGVLQDAPPPPPHLAPAVVSRLKIMAELDIAERRVPQDGRIRLRLKQRQVDVRVSTVPTLHGESIVLRLLDGHDGRVRLQDLGMADDVLGQFTRMISRPNGIVLATGPTGSGKTTSLYAAIEAIRTGREKILTVEDPVEYELPGVPQLPVNERVGMTFATALRSLLRQDPDVLLVGEIRDQETAQIATHAALTGHLVLSTLHTNDAPGALTRLLDLGVESYLIASTVHAVLAQRLVRRICSGCRARVDVSAAAEPMALDLLGPRAHFHRGTGCDECRGTGYHGRTGIYELLVLNDDFRAELGRERATGDLRRLAIAHGMRTLREDGIRLVRAGVTTPEEVLRVAHT